MLECLLDKTGNDKHSSLLQKYVIYGQKRFYNIDSRIVTESKLQFLDKLPNYSGELAVSFSSYPEADLRSTSVYFKAPEDFTGNQVTML